MEEITSTNQISGLVKLAALRNFMALSKALFTGGMPNADQLKSTAQEGVETVINLAPHDAPYALPNEAQLVASLGMHYINIPVNWNTPTKDGLKMFIEDTLKRNREGL